MLPSPEGVSPGEKMGPKKKDVEVKKIPLGRPSNNLKLGVVGVPNAGKTTVFNVLAKLKVETSSVPFQTTDSQEARVKVPDDRFTELCKRFKPQSEVPAAISVFDTCGIVKDSNKGEGMGMQFVSNIQQVDGLINCVRVFDDEDIVHLEDTIDPVRDLQTIEDELIAKDLAWVDARLTELEKSRQQKDKAKEKLLDLFKTVKTTLEEKKPIRTLTWNPIDVDILNEYNFLTAKSQLYLLNLSEKDFVRKKNKWLAKVAAWVKEHDEGAPMIPICATLEEELTHSSEEEQKKRLDELGEGVKFMREKCIQTGYGMLQLQHFFTTGPDEVRAWTIRRGTKAPQAAGVVHSDMERGFISADVYKYEDFIAEGSEAALKACGKMRQQGKDYEVLDGDCCLFKFNVTAKKK